MAPNVGDRFISLDGERDDDDGVERLTPPGSIGTVMNVYEEFGGADLLFDNGAWVVPFFHELSNTTQYRKVD